MPFWTTCDVFAPAIALGHVTGRLGLLRGRLLLRAADDAAVGHHVHNPLAAANVGTPLGIPLHPTQLYEAGARTADPPAPARHRTAREAVSRPHVLAYMFLYAVSRYIIEIYRGDPRGTVFGMSTSQFISLVLAPLSVVDADLAVAAARRRRGIASEKPPTPFRSGFTAVVVVASSVPAVH